MDKVKLATAMDKAIKFIENNGLVSREQIYNEIKDYCTIEQCDLIIHTTVSAGLVKAVTMYKIY